MNGIQMAVILMVAAAVLIIIGIAFEYSQLTLVSLPFSVGATYCSYKKDWK